MMPCWQMFELRMLMKLTSRLATLRAFTQRFIIRTTFISCGQLRPCRDKKALSIRSARRVVENVRVEQVQQFPTIEFFRTIPLLSLVRFGDWDAIMLEPAPHPDFKFSQAIWHYARGVAQSAQGDFVAAQESALALTELKDDVKVSFLDKMDYPGSTLLSIAQHLLAGEIAYRSGRFDDAVPEFEDAVAAQTLPYTEPPFWYYPTRQSLGAALLGAGQHRRCRGCLPSRS